MKQNQNNQADSWINFPRHILSLLRNGHLTRREYQMYMYLRHNCNPYGVGVANLSDINATLFGSNVEDNWVYKVMWSLKKKRLIWYSNRQGVRGSHEVHFGDFLIPNGNIKTLDKYFNPESVRSGNNISVQTESDITPEAENLSQKLEVQKSALKSHFSLCSKYSQVRSRNTDNDNKKKNDITDMSALKTFNKEESRNLITRRFTPQNNEEEVIWTIAQEIGEEDMKFLFSIHRKHGVALIECAYGQFKETRSKETIDNPPAYLNKIIQRLISEKEK